MHFHLSDSYRHRVQAALIGHIGHIGHMASSSTKNLLEEYHRLAADTLLGCRYNYGML